MLSDREYFNQRAKDWDTVCIHDLKKVKYIIDLVDIKPSDKVLDVGTGTGVLIPHIVQCFNDGHVIGVDVSENMLEIAKKKVSSKNVQFYHGDVLEIDWNTTFDIIICYSMFPHFKEHKMKAIKHLSQLLNKDGKLCIAHSQSRNEINQLHLKAGEEVKNDRLPEMSILENAFNANYLEPIKVLDNESYFVIIGRKKI
jgi:demethylmenaquinone methyltransferase/2-methoxy-6-polyprenyl-1,4-benzoquinol methylase